MNSGFARELEARAIEDGFSAVPCTLSGMLKVIPAEALLCDVVCVGGKEVPVVELPAPELLITGLPPQAEIASPDSKKASAFLTSISFGIEG